MSVSTTAALVSVTLRRRGGDLSAAELAAEMGLTDDNKRHLYDKVLPRMHIDGLLVAENGRLTETPQGVAVAELAEAITRTEVPCHWVPIVYEDGLEHPDEPEYCASCGAIRDVAGICEGENADFMLDAEDAEEGWPLDRCPLRAAS